jgi:DNA modification methylase
MKTYHKNPRTIKDKQFNDLRAWLLELGDLSGIVHDLTSDEVISGNQRMRAIDVAKCEIVLTEGPHDPDAQGTVAHGYVIWQGAKYNYRQVRWDARQCEKANIVANKAGGAWDFDVLANEFEMGDLLEWGFEEIELGFMPPDEVPDDPGAQIDKAEELRERWGVETGQLWQLGEHRLVCGDCTDSEVVARVMGGEVGDLLLTDPPYNVGIEYGSGTNDRKTLEQNEAFIRKWFERYQAVSLKVVTPGVGYGMNTLRSWLTMFPPRWMCLWIRRNGSSRTPLRGFQSWEPILFYEREEMDADAEWGSVMVYGKTSLRVMHDVFDIPVGSGTTGLVDENGNLLHPVPKPLLLFEVLLRAFSKIEQIVVEPFLGSGTTLIACERLGRRCRAIEISPAYVAVALQRWADMTGGTPVLTGDNSDA